MKDFSNEEIQEMRAEFTDLLMMIDRPKANIQGLIDKLDESDFYTAPASTRFHNSIRGGLVNHCLNVYYNLEKLVQIKALEYDISAESRIIVALLHDMAKINFYEPSIRNRKVYSEDGSKWDNLGRYEWVSEMSYAVKPEKDRFLYGSHEETSEFMARCYIPLTIEESISILHHHSGMSNDSTVNNISSLYTRFPLACLLHLADMMATFVDEK